jgi:hypothetical protein
MRDVDYICTSFFAIQFDEIVATPGKRSPFISTMYFGKMRVANVGADALRRVHGTKYDIGTTAQLGEYTVNEPINFGP